VLNLTGKRTLPPHYRASARLAGTPKDDLRICSTRPQPAPAENKYSSARTARRALFGLILTHGSWLGATKQFPRLRSSDACPNIDTQGNITGEAALAKSHVRPPRHRAMAHDASGQVVERTARRGSEDDASDVSAAAHVSAGPRTKRSGVGARSTVCSARSRRGGVCVYS
jgi:hypothetical protein